MAHASTATLPSRAHAAVAAPEAPSSSHFTRRIKEQIAELEAYKNENIGDLRPMTLLTPLLAKCTADKEFSREILMEARARIVAEMSLDMKIRELRVKLGADEAATTLKSGFWYAATYYELATKFAADDEETVMRVKNFVEDGTFYNGLPPKGFRLAENTHGVFKKDRYTYCLDQSMTPSEALDAIDTSLSFIDCLTVYQIANHILIRQILGIERFNAIYTHHSLETPYDNLTGIILDRSGVAPSDILFTRTHVYFDADLTKGSEERDTELGRPAYFTGHPHADRKDTQPAYMGSNVLCASATPGKQLYVGLGVFLKDESQIMLSLLTSFNLAIDDSKLLPKKEWSQLKPRDWYRERERLRKAPNCSVETFIAYPRVGYTNTLPAFRMLYGASLVYMLSHPDALTPPKIFADREAVKVE